MSFLAELQRRKVFKVGVAYLVVAWLAAQAAGLVFPTFGAPEWALRAFMFVLLLGFPIALVMAWVLQVTPEGVRVEAPTAGTRRFYALAGVLTLLAVAWFYKGQPAYLADDPQAQDGPSSVAVLPFANLSGDPTQEFFSDGMTEEILNVLAKIPDLKVAARTSVFEFKGRGGDIREMGRKLGVDYIVEGSVRRDAAKVRITAQLIRVSDGFHVWSETYDRELQSVFEVQDDIAKQIAGQLRGALAPSEAPMARPDIDPAAYEDYLIARNLYRSRTGVFEAIFRFQRTTALAPSFAPAWASLSLALEVAPGHGTPVERAMLGPLLAQIRDAAEHARALAPDDAMTLHALANVARAEARYADAEDGYRRAISIDPTYPDVREDFSELLDAMGRAEEALKEARELVELEPLVPVFWAKVIHAGLTLRREDVIADALAQIEASDLRVYAAEMAKHNLAIARGELAEAGAVLEQKYKDAPWESLEEMFMWRWSQGDPAADDLVARMAMISDAQPADYAALRGELDLFFSILADPRGATWRYLTFRSLTRWNIPEAIADPRAKQLLREFGFETYWRAKGWPALCRPKGESDFECSAAFAQGGQ